MLNRRILRIKVFKAIYTYAENPGMTLKELESLLELSCESTRDLYLFMLSVTKPLTEEALSRIESARNKFNPTEEERNPNMKFVRNRIPAILSSDPDFTKIVSKKKLGWAQYDVLLRKLYDSIKAAPYYQAYMEDESESLKKDAALWRKIFENEFEELESLSEVLEDLSIYWNDDLAYALTWCCRTMDSLGKGESWNLPPLYQSDMDASAGKSSDKAFAVNLLRAAYTGFGRYYDLLAENTPKWDKNRICATDVALIVCGLAESEAFTIPSKIIINEYVEISKYYSTPESRSFVNGVLDRLIKSKQE